MGGDIFLRGWYVPTRDGGFRETSYEGWDHWMARPRVFEIPFTEGGGAVAFDELLPGVLVRTLFVGVDERRVNLSRMGEPLPLVFRTNVVNGRRKESTAFASLEEALAARAAAIRALTTV